MFIKIHNLQVTIKYRVQEPAPDMEYGMDPRIKRISFDKYEWTYYNSPMKSLNNTDYNMVRYRHTICVRLSEEQTSYEEEWNRVEKEVCSFVSIIEKNVGKVRLIKSQFPIHSKDKLYAIDYILIFEEPIFIADNRYLIGRLGIVCYKSPSNNIFLAFDENGLLYRFISKPYQVNIGDIIVFKIIRKDDSNTFSLYPDFIPISKFNYDESNKCRIIENTIYCYLFPYCFKISPSETLLLKYFFNRKEFDRNINYRFIFEKEYDTLRKYISNLDINKIVDTYKVIINEIEISRTYYEALHSTKYFLETEDNYIKSLFTLKERSFRFDIEWENLDKLRRDWRDIKFENKEKKRALRKYSPSNHLKFLLAEKIEKFANYQEFMNRFNEVWVLKYFTENLKRIHKSKIHNYIEIQNKTVLDPLGFILEFSENSELY